MSLELSDDHVAEICRVLLDQRVQFVVIGGVAARLHDTGHATIDIDVARQPMTKTWTAWPKRCVSSTPAYGLKVDLTASPSIHTQPRCGRSRP
ncbi:MAG: hypothetical protein GY708_14860 [Actinomycetia bacterium]|nr:hypothetical protein [Actinomycetes bacterium]